MSNDRIGEPWPGATYNGFAGGAPSPQRNETHGARDGATSPGRGRMTRGAILGGVAAALAAGLLFGFLAKPDRDEEAARTTPVGVGSATVPVEVAQVQPPPAPAATDKLEVLPSDLALPPPPPPLPPMRAESRPAPTLPSTRTEARPAAPARQAAEPPGVPAAARVTDVPPPPATSRFVDAAPDPSFNCAYARSRSERLVCADRGLARLDRRLDRAFRTAVRSGVPYRELRAEQDDWLMIREDAARRSPEAVESIYRQRIAELEDMAWSN